ncbi:MAG TPA: YcxB family protein [Thermoanaerobaculia bacterium]|jgi:hypothetical protein|nr:YcxB family protein [Thermoanaerobaculia bacterium]
MDDCIICTYEWTAAQAKEAWREHWRLVVRPPFRWTLHIIYFAIAVVTIANLTTGKTSFDAMAVFIVFFLAYLFGPVEPLWSLGPLGWLQRRQFARRPDAGVTIEWTANEEGLRVKTGDLTRSELAWKAIVKCVRVRRGFLVYLTDTVSPREAIFHLLPDSGFASPELAARFGLLAEQRAPRFENSGWDSESTWTTSG